MRITKYETAFPSKATGRNRAGTVYANIFDSVAEMGRYVKEHGKADETGASSKRGGLTYAQALDKCFTGDESAVPASDALLGKFEQMSLDSAGSRWSDDVAGCVPNVPAFVSGSPLSMRRKVRDENIKSPIAIVMDVTASWLISPADLQRRGVAVLALVRTLAMVRPVELWCGSIVGADNDSNGVAMFARIDTTPLDLATAGYAMTNAAFLRHICFALGRKYGFSGGWPFNDDQSTRKHFRTITAPIFEHVGDMIYIPAVLSGADTISNPVEWIQEKLREHGVANIGEMAG